MQFALFLLLLLLCNLVLLVAGYAVGWLYGISYWGAIGAQIAFVPLWAYGVATLGDKILPKQTQEQHLLTLGVMVIVGVLSLLGIGNMMYYRTAAASDATHTLRADNFDKDASTKTLFYTVEGQIRTHANLMQGISVQEKNQKRHVYVLPIFDEQGGLLGWLPAVEMENEESNWKKTADQLALRFERLIAQIKPNQIFINFDHAFHADGIARHTPLSELQEAARLTWVERKEAFPSNTTRFLLPISSKNDYRADIWRRLLYWGFGSFNAAALLAFSFGALRQWIRRT